MPTFISSSSAGGSNASGISGVTRPSTNIGDFIVLDLYYESLADDVTGGITFSNGTWTKRALVVQNTSTDKFTVIRYTSVYNSEGSTFNITWNGVIGAVWRTAALTSWSGVHATTPMDATPTMQAGAFADTTPIAPSITTTHANSRLVYMSANFAGTTGSAYSSGFTEHVDFDAFHIASANQAAAGASGNKQDTIGTTAWWSAGLMALQDSGVVDPTPTVVGAGTASFTATTATALTPTLPTGWAADDIHILLAARSDNTAMTALSGWTQISAANNTTAQRTEVWARRAVAGDTNPSVTFGSGTTVRGARIIGIRGVDPGIALSSLIFTHRSNAASNIITFDSTTTIDANNLLLAMYTYEDDPSNASLINTGWTTFATSTSALGNDMAMGYATKPVPIASSTGTMTSIVSVGTWANSVNSGIVIAFPPIPNTAITGTGDLTVSHPSFSGAGDYIAPPISASGGSSIRVGALAGAGTLVYPGAGGVVLRAPLLAGVGALVYAGNGGLVVGAPSFAGVGLLAYVGGGGLVLRVPALGGAGLLAYAGVGGVSLGVGQLSGSGAAIGPPTGTGTLVIGHPSFVGSGLLAYAGAGGILVSTPSFGGVGVLQYVGLGGVVLGVGSFAGSGVYSISGSGGILLSHPDFTGGGVFLPSTGGFGTVSIGVPAFAGGGTLIYGGLGGLSVSVPSLAGSGVLTYIGSGGVVIGVAGLGGVGDYIPLGEGAGGISVRVSSFGGVGYLSYAGIGGLVIGTASFAGAGVLAYVAGGGIAIGYPAFGGVGAYIATIQGAGALLVGVPAFGGAGAFGMAGSGGISIDASSFIGSGTLSYLGDGGVVVTVPSFVGGGAYRPEDISSSGGIIIDVGYFSGDGNFVGAPISGLGGLIVRVPSLVGMGIVVGLMPSIVGVPVAVMSGGMPRIAFGSNSSVVFVGRSVGSKVVAGGGSRVEWEKQ